MTKDRAIKLLTSILKATKNAEFERGYFQCSDYDYYALSCGITNKELKELGLPEAAKDFDEAEGR